MRPVSARCLVSRLKCLLFPVCLALAASTGTGSRTAGQTIQGEQSTFGTEEVPGEPFLRRPVPVPDAVSEVLRRDHGVQSCLEYNPLPSGEPLSSWFLASEIHLDGPNETDLMVLANPEPGKAYLCFHSVEGISWFWVFRQTAGQSELILKAPGQGMDALKARHSGYKDIQTVTGGQAGRYLTTITYRFDGKRYRQYRERTREVH